VQSFNGLKCMQIQSVMFKGDCKSFHFLTRLTQDKELSSYSLFHFLMSLTQDKELCSYSLFHFLTSLTQDKELCSYPCFIF
jgi:hypothetical protein